MDRGEKKKTAFRFSLLNLLLVFYLTLLALLSPFFLLPGLIVRWLGNPDRGDRMINRVARWYSRLIFFLFGVRVKVKGLENIPSSRQLCLVSNHQGLADIPLIIAYVPITAGFIAKKELGRIPFLNLWLRAMKCVMIDRSSPRHARTAIAKAMENIRNGYPMVIFPEGTRSRSHAMGHFKPGSFKLITGSDCIALPITIDGTYKLIEETGKVTPSKIFLTIHPPVDVSQLPEAEKAKLHLRFENTIRSALG